MIGGIVLAATAALLTGPWHGALTLFGADIEMTVVISGTPDSLQGTLDIPSQGVNRSALRDVRARGDSVSFVFPAPGEPARFEGVQRRDSIVGTFRQAGLTAPFRLARGDAPAAVADPSLPYDAEEVRIPSGAVTLAGTLTRPRGTALVPVLILVSGSGPQNRDENLLGFKPFAILADHLARHGIAVLRCDDRGVGGSTGNFSASTSLDFADDLRAATRFLSKRPGIDRHRIGALGHSEGGIIAPLVAASSDSIAYLVLLGAPGVRGDSVILDQGERISRALAWDDTLRALNHEAQVRIIHSVQSEQGWDETRVAVEAALRRALRGTPDSTIRTAADAQMKAMQSPWMRTFLTHDPRPPLQKVRCPVLALFGQHDLQVAPALNAPPLEHALRQGGNRDVTVRVIPRANHLFQPTDNGNPSLYGSLPKEFAPGLLDTMTSWLSVRTRPAAAPTTAKTSRTAKR
jgi:pimeloyl-ACP methyl ester carboxylesterase